MGGTSVTAHGVKQNLQQRGNSYDKCHKKPSLIQAIAV